MHSTTENDQAFSCATAQLLTPASLDLVVLGKILAEVTSRNVDYADLYLQYTRRDNWRLEDGVVKAGSFSIDQGVGIRANCDERTAYSYSDVISERSLMDAARVVRSIAGSGQDRNVSVTQKTTRHGSPAYQASDPTMELDHDAKIRLLRKCEMIGRAKDPRVTKVMVNLACEYDVIMVVTTEGRVVSDIRPLAHLSVIVIAEERGTREIGTCGGGGREHLSYFTDLKLTEYVDKAVAMALHNLEAQPAPAGEMPVVLGPGGPGILLHEAVGHGLEADYKRRGTSAYSNSMGQQVAAKGVTILDDGSVPGRRGSLNVDDEGHVCQRNVLIDDGVLCGYLHDTLSARLMGCSPTGNGRRENYASMPLPRMTNTFMLGGAAHPGEIVSSLKKGLFCTEFGGGRVDIVTGDFAFAATEAFWVENGKVQYPVKGATIIGNGPKALKGISLIGNDMAFDRGAGDCAKNGQNLPVSVGQPTIRVDGLTIGGTR